MCTMIQVQAPVEGSGKGTADWFRVRKVNVSYEHPFHAPYELSLNIDFFDEREGLGARVSAELTAASARRLVEAIERVLARAEAAGHLEAPPPAEARA